MLPIDKLAPYCNSLPLEYWAKKCRDKSVLQCCKLTSLTRKCLIGKSLLIVGFILHYNLSVQNIDISFRRKGPITLTANLEPWFLKKTNCIGIKQLITEVMDAPLSFGTLFCSEKESNSYLPTLINFLQSRLTMWQQKQACHVGKTSTC